MLKALNGAFAKDESGATAIEYALMCALISVLVLAAIAILGDPVTGLYGSIPEHFRNINL